MAIMLCFQLGLEPIVKLKVSSKCKHFNKFVASKYAAQGKC